MGISNDLVWPHHLVVLMLQQMTVPDVASGISLEWNNDPRDRARRSAYCVLHSGFIRIRRKSRARVANSLFQQILVDIQRAPVQDLKPHQMEMNGMGVVG